MSRITDYILEPKVVYTEGGFLVRVKVQDDYKYKKYLVSEDVKYVTIENTSFTLTDASSTKQASITEIKGNTTQEGTPTPSSPIEVNTVSGDNNIVIQNKNLLANDIWEVGTISGTTGQNNNANNRIRTIGYVRVKPNTTYTLFIDQDTTTTAFVFEYDKQYSNFSRIPSTWTTMPFTFTTKSTTEYIRVLFGTSTISTAEKVQLEQNNQATSYIAHQGNSYRVDLKGKNLFNDILRQGVTTYNTGVWGNSYTRITSTDWIKSVKAGTYTISAKTSTTKTLQVSMVTFNTSGTFYNVSGVSGQWKTMPSTFTIPVDMQLKCNISYTNGSNITPSEVTEIQLEEGSEATPYEPYYNYELCKIGNYQDKLYYDSGKWYIEKQVGKVVLDGSETWGGGNSSSGSPNYTYAYTNAIDSYVKSGYYGALSDKLVNLNADMQTISVVSTDTLGVGSTATYKLRIMVLTSRLGTANLNGFKTWLGSNNITVYYVLATPTYTEITDTYLLSQLNALKDIQLYDNLCYVDWVGKKAATMSLQYAVTDETLHAFIITEDGKKIRTDWRKLGRRKKWKMK